MHYDEKVMEGLLTFIEERSNIWHRKEVQGLPAPWTDDPILAGGKFGNIWRELDRGTQWELDKLAKIDGPLKKLEQLRLILIYRHNLIPATTEMLLIGAKPDQLVLSNIPTLISDVIKIYPLSNRCTRNDWAYYVWCHMNDIVSNALTFLLATQHNKNPIYIHAKLQQSFPRLDAFKAYEVMTSLTYLDWWQLSEDDFPYVGHGALPALNMLCPDISDGLQIVNLVELTPVVKVKLIERGIVKWPTSLTRPYHHFSVRTFEDALCEYRKYLAVKAGSRSQRPYPDNLGRWNNA